MLYQRINLAKLYEQTSSEAVGGDGQAAESFPKGAEAAKSAKREILKGNAYAFPVKKEEYNEIMSLINSGSGDWMSKEPIKFLMSGRESTKPATMKVGETNKPIYLMIRLSRSKGDARSKPLVLEKEDRIYVALVMSAENLKKNLEEADNISKSVKLPVLTPLMKGGKNVEHSIQMWLDFDEGSAEIVKDDEIEPGKTERGDNMDNVEQIQSDQPGLAAQLDLPESRKRFVGGKWKPINEAFKMVRYEDGSSPNRWLYDDVSKKAYLVSSPERYRELVAKYGISDTAVSMPKSEIDAAAAAAKRPVTVDDLAKVEAGTVLKSGRSGKAVEELQAMLGIEADGKFGPQTKKAVEKFQQDNGLKVDGIVGKNTLTALRKKKSDAAAAKTDAKAKADAVAAKTDAKVKADTDAAAVKTDAKAKADAAAQRQTDDKDLEEMGADELRAELDKSKIELKAARKEARQERRSDRQDRREARRDARQEERLRRRVEKIQKKIEKATNESKIYNFDEFVKILHGFQHK